MTKSSLEEQPQQQRPAAEQTNINDIDIPTSPMPELISVSDLELFHHFTIATYRTIVDDPDLYDVWQNHVVKWSFHSPSILHLILAFSALHLGHGRPALRDWYVQQADRHFTFGVQSVTAVLSQFNEANCQRVYIASVLICLVYFGRGPRLGEYLVFNDSGPAEWLVLMNGVKMMLQSHQDRIFSGVLEPKREPQTYVVVSSLCGELQQHTAHVQALQRLIDHEVPDEIARIMYRKAINDLLKTVYKVYAKLSAQVPQVGLMQEVLGWLYKLPAEILNRLQQKEPLALAVLAYWAVLLRHMGQVWFMKGWDEHVLSGICASLPADYQQWVEWPLQQVRMCASFPVCFQRWIEWPLQQDGPNG